MSRAGDNLYAALEPYAGEDQANGSVLYHLAQAIGKLYDELDGLAVGEGVIPGWIGALDPDTAPDSGLAWLGQFCGTRPVIGESADARRDRVRDVAGLRRGTPAAIAAVTQATLGGSKLVRIGERPGGEAYQVLVATRADQTPDPALTEAAIRAAIPAGIVLEYVVSNDLVYNEVAEDLDDYADVEATFTDYQHLLTNDF